MSIITEALLLSLMLLWGSDRQELSTATSQEISSGNDAGFKIQLGQKSRDPCHYDRSPVDMCDQTHQRSYSQALDRTSPNFAFHYRLVQIPGRRMFNQVSLAIIDMRDKNVYAVPIDFFAPSRGHATDSSPNPYISFSTSGTQLCLRGELAADRIIHDGNACFVFDGLRFTGYDTPYTEAGEWPR